MEISEGLNLLSILHDDIKSLQRDVKTLTEKLAFLEGADFKNTLMNHGQRISKVEQNVGVIYGISAFVSGLVAFVVPFIKGLFFNGN